MRNVRRGKEPSQITITKVKENGAETAFVSERIKLVGERVRERAYELSQRRGHSGDPFQYWLQAERELIWAPQSDLIEKNGQFQLQVAVPGFDPDQVSVTVSAKAVTVSAESAHTHDETDGNLHFCEFGEKTLLRKLDLPAAIDVDKVTARLDKGVLQILAEKAAAAPKPRSKKIAATSA